MIQKARQGICTICILPVPQSGFRLILLCICQDLHGISTRYIWNNNLCTILFNCRIVKDTSIAKDINILSILSMESVFLQYICTLSQIGICPAQIFCPISFRDQIHLIHGIFFYILTGITCQLLKIIIHRQNIPWTIQQISAALHCMYTEYFLKCTVILRFCHLSVLRLFLLLSELMNFLYGIRIILWYHLNKLGNNKRIKLCSCAFF